MSSKKKAAPLAIANNGARLSDEEVSAGGAPADAGASADLDAEIIDTDLAAETLTGDLRDLILDTLRNEQDKRPWNQRSEAQQHETADRIESACHAWARKAVELIAAGGRRTIKATIEQVVVKDGIKAVLTMSKFDELRHNLVDAQGSTVLIVVADPEEYEGERAPAKITPDQPPLPIADAEPANEAPI